MPDTVANNIDDVAPLTWPSVGWKPVCVLPSCNPGGTGTPTAVSQANNSSPNLDGAATKFSVTGPAYTNALWVYIAGVNDPATYFVADYWLEIPAPSFALAQAFEIDMFDFSTTDNVEYMMGTQYNRVLGLWQIWDSNLGWVNTGVTTAPTSGGWTHIQQQAHRVPGDLTHVYYDFIVINGVTRWYSGTVGVPVAGAAAALPGGWSSAVGIQYQIDIAAAGSGGVPVEMSIDDANFSALLVAPATGGGGGGGIDNVSPPYFLDPKPLNYYTGLLTSEYRTAPNINAFLNMLLTPVDDLNACLSGMNAAFDIDTAIGQQLDWLGQLVGASRTLPYVPVSGQLLTVQNTPATAGTGYTNGDILTVVQGGASGGTAQLHVFGLLQYLSIVTPGTGYTSAAGLAVTGGTGTGMTVTVVASSLINQVLSDADYRVLLKAEIAQNQWDGTIDSLYPMWRQLFPGGTIIINDNQDMTATIILTGVFSPTTTSMIVKGLIVPRPEGVLYNYVFGTLPLFGFDRSDGYVAGFDTGHWA